VFGGKTVRISRKSQWIIFCCVNVAVILGVLLFPFYLALAKLFPLGECALVDVCGLYCPACGGTRALASLLRFDVISSIKYNPKVLIFAVGFLFYEVIMIKHLIKGDERGIFLGMKPLYIFLAFWGVYFVVRNVLLLCGIDLLGDIL
jgi:hypothetical protein